MPARNLREALEGKLSDLEVKLLGRSFDIVGDVGIVKIPEPLLQKKKLIGEALMSVHKNLRTVLMQTSPVSGEFRTRKLEVIAGDPNTETVHKEYGCLFKVDLSKVYFSPRLATERMRISSLVRPSEVVVNMFAGVGCYSIIMAKHSDVGKVYSIDKNPVAVRYMHENVRINKVGGKVVPICGDAGEVIEKQLRGKADRVLMPLPESAREFLDSALTALRPQGGVIHFYDFGEDPDPFGPSIKFVRERLSERRVEVTSKRIVRSYAPRVYHIVLDLLICRE